MINHNFEQDDPCYDDKGNEYAYVAAAPGGHIVCPVLEIQGGYDEPPYTEFGEPTFRTHLFPGVPTHKLHEDIAKLDKQINGKRAELNDLRTAVNGFEKIEKDRLARLKRHQNLEHLDRILSGEVTHYVVVDSLDIITAMQAKAEYENRKMRLLTINVEKGYGAPDKLTWNLNQYSDGSGFFNPEVLPCFSEAEAVEKLKAAISDKWRGWKTPASAYGFTELAKASKKYNVALPEGFEAALKQVKERELIDKIKSAETVIPTYSKQLQELNGSTA